jgi:hypothetical protein
MTKDATESKKQENKDDGKDKKPKDEMGRPLTEQDI